MQESDWTATELTAKSEIETFVTRALKADNVAIALNCEGTEAMTARAYGIGLAFSASAANYDAAYIPIPADHTVLADIVAVLKPLFATPSITIIGADIKRDMLILRRFGITFEGSSYFDISVAHYLCQPEQKHDVSTLAMTYLGYADHDYNLPQAERKSLPLDPLSAMTERAVICLRLKPLLENEIAGRDQSRLLTDIKNAACGCTCFDGVGRRTHRRCRASPPCR